MEKSLAVIGGGASAVLLLAHLAREKKTFDKIVVFDRAGIFGKGVAYGTTNLSHPLNVRAANMSGYADVKDDLVQWLSRNGHPYDGGDFIPRPVFARYLRDLLDISCAKLPVTFVCEDVLAARAMPFSKYEIETASARQNFDEVILATGNVRPIAPDVDGACRVFFKTPYNIDYSQVSKARHVAMIGSGLSCVDAISALEQAGFAGKFTVISRGGYFPRPHAAPQLWEGGAFPLPARPVATWLKDIRAHVARAVEAGMPWQAGIDSLRGHTNPIWQSLTTRQRDIFMRHGLTLWNIHRHRMPPESAALIDRLKAAGRLNIVRDRALRIDAKGGIECRHGMVNGADFVINALGYRYDEKGRDYEVSYKLGPANFGDLFETTAIPEIRAQAHEIARKLCL